MMFPVCSQSCSHSKPFPFMLVPSVPSTTRAHMYVDGVEGAPRINMENDREHWEQWEQASKQSAAARSSE